nr:hypothetical protein [Nostoc sp. C052]
MATFLLISHKVSAQDWCPVRGGIPFGISGMALIEQQSDAGDDGPFQSAVYVAGYLGLCDRKITWRANPQLVPFYRSDYHKIEGIELVPGAEGGVVVGTDDENLGSYVYIVGASS